VVEAVRESGAKVVALSALLATTVKEISAIGKALRDAHLRDKVKIIVGAAALNMELAKALGTDGYGANAV
jgi:5-methyltetrahydrofolate--homocysteine methyltransferase